MEPEGWEHESPLFPSPTDRSLWNERYVYDHNDYINLDHVHLQEMWWNWAEQKRVRNSIKKTNETNTYGSNLKKFRQTHCQGISTSENLVYKNIQRYIHKDWFLLLWVKRDLHPKSLSHLLRTSSPSCVLKRTKYKFTEKSIQSCNYEMTGYLFITLWSSLLIKRKIISLAHLVFISL